MDRKIIAALQVSLDGLIEGPEAEVDWIDNWGDPFEVLPEIYTCIAGQGTLELDDEVVALEPGVVVVIPPGVRHRARPGGGGVLRVVNTVIPPFTSEDEWVD